MIDKSEVERIIKDFAGETDLFLVEVSVSPYNVVHVEVDRPDGISIDECVELNRFINENLDREVEDFELEVSSPGIGSAFKVYHQYLKNIRRTVEVITTDGSKLVGTLLSATENEIEIEVEKKIRKEGKKRPEIAATPVSVMLSEINSTKVLISFK